LHNPGKASNLGLWLKRKGSRFGNYRVAISSEDCSLKDNLFYCVFVLAIAASGFVWLWLLLKLAKVVVL